MAIGEAYDSPYTSDPPRLSSLGLLLLRTETLRNLIRKWRLNAGERRDTDEYNGDEDEENDQEHEDETWSQELVSFQDTTLMAGVCLHRVEGRARRGLAGMQGDTGGARVDYEVVGEDLLNLGELAGEPGF